MKPNPLASGVLPVLSQYSGSTPRLLEPATQSQMLMLQPSTKVTIRRKGFLGLGPIPKSVLPSAPVGTEALWMKFGLVSHTPGGPPLSLHPGSRRITTIHAQGPTSPCLPKVAEAFKPGLPQVRALFNKVPNN